MNTFLKNLLLILIGISLGILFFSFYQKNVISIESEADNLTHSETNQILESGDTNEVVELKKTIQSLQAKLSSTQSSKNIDESETSLDSTDDLNTSHSKNTIPAEVLTNYIEMKEREENRQLTAEDNLKAQAILDSLKAKKDPILNKLLSSYSGKALDKLNDSYKQHLIEDVDMTWANAAETFLNNFFTANATNFEPHRVSCRTSTCEISGMIQIPYNQLSIDSSNQPYNSPVMSLSRSLSQTDNFGNFFSGNSHTYNPEPKDGSNLSVYVIFLQRAK